MPGHMMIFPCKWQEFDEDGWLNKQVELYARKIQPPQDLDNFLKKARVGLSDLLDKVAVPSGFEKMQWVVNIEDDLNKWTYPQSQWAHLKNNGVWGGKLRDDIPVFGEYMELIILMANVLAGAGGHMSKLGSARDCAIPGSADGWTLNNTESGYLTCLASGVTISFLCRDPKCLFYGIYDQWIKHPKKEQFRCPRCAKLYQPGNQTNGEFPAQKVFSCRHPKTGRTMVIPCKWPDSEEDSWLYKQAELDARKVQTPTDLDDFLKKSFVELGDLLKRVAVPIDFKKLTWDTTIEQLLVENNYPKSQWAHLERNGVWGATLMAASDVQVFEGFRELIRLLGNLLAGAKLIVSKM